MKPNLEIKVGLFLFIGLVLLGILMLQFSKGTSVFRPTYTILLKSGDAGGLKERAAVLMSGVQVGSVSGIQLADGGRSVVITLTIDKRFRIPRNTRFVLEQSGFLGDQYVAVQPGEGEAGGYFEDRDSAVTEQPFNLQQAARSASGLIERLNETALRLNDAIGDIHRLLLNEETLTNLSATAANLRQVSERGLSMVERVDSVVASNSPAISLAGSNLVVFSEEMASAGGGINEFIATNKVEIASAIRNLEDSTEMLKITMQDIRAGKGVAGTLLQDEKVAGDLAAMARNLSITSSNLNRLGLWGILWKKKPPREQTATGASERIESPKHASQ